MKQLQNRIAESGLTLAVASLAGLVVWLLSGLLSAQLWPQLACFVATVYLIVELSNQNALLRVRSRMVSSTFILLSCTACFLFPSLSGAVVQLCFAAAFLLLFQTYQDPQAVGRSFYAFVAVGIASLVFVHVLWLVPLLWVLMATQLQALSWRTWVASLIGLATPYWFALLWLVVPVGPSAEWTVDLSPLADHFEALASGAVFVVPQYSLSLLLSLGFTMVLTVAGIVHFWHYSFEDKIRIRLLFGFFTTLAIVAMLLVLLYPRHAHVLMRIVLLAASPLVAHLFTFTGSRLSNIFFFVALAVDLAIMALAVAMLQA